MNIHTIHGRLTRDPEFTRGQEENGDRAKFTVAVDHRYGDGAEFIDCIVWGKRAGVISKYFHKGSEIILSGEGKNNSYEGKDGVKRKAYSVTVSDFDFCGSRNDGKPTEPAPQQTETEPVPVLDEDIPF